jgi:hypothetical protein
LLFFAQKDEAFFLISTSLNTHISRSWLLTQSLGCCKLADANEILTVKEIDGYVGFFFNEDSCFHKCKLFTI